MNLLHQKITCSPSGFRARGSGFRGIHCFLSLHPPIMRDAVNLVFLHLAGLIFVVIGAGLIAHPVMAQPAVTETNASSGNQTDPPIPGVVALSDAGTEKSLSGRRLLVNVPSVGVIQQPSSSSSSQLPVLQLDEVLVQVEANHPKLLGADVERRIASAKRLEKEGAFDPIGEITNEYLRYNSSSSPGKVSEAFTNEFGVGFLTRYGAKIFAGYRLNQEKVKSPLSLTGEGGEYFVALKIPLLRGARINEKAIAERQARLGEPLADVNFAQNRLDLLLKASVSYWDWVAAKRKMDVARNLLDIARFRSTAIQERADLGDLPPIDKVEAEQEVRRREGNLTKSERDLQKAAFKLSLFLWQDNGLPAPLPVADQVPVMTPPPVVPAMDVITRARTEAIDRRPELRGLQIQRDITQLDLDLAQNQRLPAVDFTVSPGRDVGDQGIGSTIKAGVSITLPLRQRTADGRAAASRLKIQKLELETRSERLRILTEVDDAVSALQTAEQRYQAAQQELQLAITLERGERDRFALGDSTLFLVNQRERATAEAATKVIEVQAEFEQAKAAFRAAAGQF